jgi:3-oxoacyl-[acyl-carrier-protein] synthase II
LGAITPLGNDAQNTCAAVKTATPALMHNEIQCNGIPCRIDDEVKDFDPLRVMTLKGAQRTDPFIQYAPAASLMAVEDLRLTIAPHSALCTRILIGSGRGNVTTVEKNMAAYLI